MSELIERAAKVLAFQRRTDIGDDERFSDDGNREGYWRSLPELTRALLRLRAAAVLGAALDPEDEAMIEAVARRLCDAWHSDVPDAKADDVVLDLNTHPAVRCYRWHGYVEQAVVAIAALKAIAQTDGTQGERV